MRPCTRTRSIKDAGAIEGEEQQLLDMLERDKEDLLYAGDVLVCRKSLGKEMSLPIPRLG